MFRIVADNVARHDFLFTPCSQEMFELLYQHQGHHPRCFENLATALAPHGIRPAQLSTTLNIFMNVAIDTQGRVTVGVPTSRAGDYLELEAQMDLLCGPHGLLSRGFEQRLLQAHRLLHPRHRGRSLRLKLSDSVHYGRQ